MSRELDDVIGDETVQDSVGEASGVGLLDRPSDPGESAARGSLSTSAGVVTVPINEVIPDEGVLGEGSELLESLVPAASKATPVGSSVVEKLLGHKPQKARKRVIGQSQLVRTWKERFPHGVSWVVVVWMAAMHIGAVAALWHFSWAGLLSLVVLHFVSACLGVTLGYHRLLTHGGFLCHRGLRYFFSLCGMLSGEGSPLKWVATHRKHHVYSDQDGDPHSPNEGFWWAHFLWLQPKETDEEIRDLFTRWAPDLYRDPVQRFFHAAFLPFQVLVGIACWGVGEYVFHDGLGIFLWAMCARTVVAYHSTWFVNSATHVWGYRNYETTDRSRNLWWVALLSYGEGWHNNHHAYQRLARHGHRWFEIDITYMVIRLLRATGMATKVQDQLPTKDPTVKIHSKSAA